MNAAWRGAETAEPCLLRRTRLLGRTCLLGSTRMSLRGECVSGAVGALVRAATLVVSLFLCQSAEAHLGQGSKGSNQIELDVVIGEEYVTYDVHVPTRQYLKKVLRVDSMAAFRELDEDALTERTLSYFSETNTLKVDGLLVRPEIEALSLEVPQLQGVDLSEDAMAYEYGAIRCQLEFSTKGKPRSVGILWQLYVATEGDVEAGTAQAWQESVVVQLSAFEKTRLLILSRTEPEYVWHAEGRATAPQLAVETAQVETRSTLPTLSIVLLVMAIVCLAVWRQRIAPRLIGGGLAAAALCSWLGGIGFTAAPWRSRLAVPEPSEAVTVFETLHKNIYRAFDYSDEGLIYDTLAQSVDGALLDEIYSDVYESLILRDQGGAVCRVQSVEVLASKFLESVAESPQTDGMPRGGKFSGAESLEAVSLDEGEGFRVDCHWRVHGLVRHWGHTHARTNEFEAVYSVAPRGGVWKIIGTDVRRQERVDIEPNVEAEAVR